MEGGRKQERMKERVKTNNEKSNNGAFSQCKELLSDKEMKNLKAYK